MAQTAKIIRYRSRVAIHKKINKIIDTINRVISSEPTLIDTHTILNETAGCRRGHSAVDQSYDTATTSPTEVKAIDTTNYKPAIRDDNQLATPCFQWESIVMAIMAPYRRRLRQQKAFNPISASKRLSLAISKRRSHLQSIMAVIRHPDH